MDTPGNAIGVAIDGTRVLVADSASGLAVVDITSPAAAKLLTQVSDGAFVRCVAAGGGIAYAGTDAGTIISVDTATGAILERFTIPNAGSIQDVVVNGNYLFALTAGKLFVLPLDQGSLSVAASVACPGSVGAGGRRLRVFVGGGLAYTTHTQGYNVFDVSDPENPKSLQVNNTTQFGWRHMVPNGSGLGIAAAAPNSTDDGQHPIQIYRLGADGLGTTFVTRHSHAGGGQRRFPL